MSNTSAVSRIKSEVHALPVDSNYIPEGLIIQAKSELFEDENTRVQSLKMLRSMLQKEEHFRWQDDDLFLLAFLRARKFDVRKAFNLMKGLYVSFGKRGHIYYNLSFHHLRKIMEENCLYMLPYRNHEGSSIVCFRYSTWNPDVVSGEELLICGSLGLIQALRSPSTQIAGFHIIMDFKDFTLKHLLKSTPVVGFIGDVLQNTVPMRVRGIHVVNQNTAFFYFWNIVRNFLSKKIRERVHIHGNHMKRLHKFVHPNVLPADLGGELPPFDNADWRERMEGSADYIKHVLSFGYEKYLQIKLEKESYTRY